MKKIISMMLLLIIAFSSICTVNAATKDIAKTGHPQFCSGGPEHTDYQSWIKNKSFPYIEFGKTQYNDNTVTQYIRWQVNGNTNWYNRISKFRVFWRTPSGSWQKYKDIGFNSHTNNHRIWYDVPVEFKGSDFSKYGGVWADDYIKTYFTVRAMDNSGNFISDFAKSSYTSFVFGDWIAPRMKPKSNYSSSDNHTWSVNIVGIKGYKNASKIRFFYKNSNGKWVKLTDKGIWNFNPISVTFSAKKVSYRTHNNHQYNVSCRLIDVWGNYCSAFLYNCKGSKVYNKYNWHLEY